MAYAACMRFSRFWKRRVVKDEALSSRQREEEYRKQNLALMKTQFLRNLSRSIDSDMLNRLTRCSSQFQEMSDKSSIPKFVATIFNVGEEYGHVLTKILRYYDSLRNNFKAVHGPLLIRNIVSDAKHDAKRQLRLASSSDPVVKVEIHQGVPTSEVISDGPILKECLQELLFNGMRHGRNACVTLRVSATRHDRLYITFSVENEGVVMHQDRIVEMFTPFCNLEKQNGGEGTGVGVGLAWCKQMAVELGGDLGAHGDGTTTVLSLTVPVNHEKPLVFQSTGMRLSHDIPQERAQREGSNIFPSEAVSERADRPSVLVVDDSVIARKQFVKMMQLVDIEVDTCESALSCLEKVEAKTYDVICLDVIMPVMSGIACAEKIRGGSTPNWGTPIIMITADSSVETRQLCAYISGSMLLQKPAKRDVLFRTLMASITEPSKKEWMRKTWHEKQ